MSLARVRSVSTVCSSASSRIRAWSTRNSRWSRTHLAPTAGLTTRRFSPRTKYVRSFGTSNSERLRTRFPRIHCLLPHSSFTGGPEPLASRDSRVSAVGAAPAKSVGLGHLARARPDGARTQHRGVNALLCGLGPGPGLGVCHHVRKNLREPVLERDDHVGLFLGHAGVELLEFGRHLPAENAGFAEYIGRVVGHASSSLCGVNRGYFEGACRHMADTTPRLWGCIWAAAGKEGS